MAIMSLALMLTSCNDKQINQAKLDVAAKVGAGVEKKLSEEYSVMHVEGVDCQVEAKTLGTVAELKAIEFLKAHKDEEVVKSSEGLSPVVPAICVFAVEKILPKALEQIDTKYVCLRSLGAVKLSSLGTELCKKIEL
jgi:hypothetical protein